MPFNTAPPNPLTYKFMKNPAQDSRYPIGPAVLPEKPLTTAERPAFMQQLASLPAQLAATVAGVGAERLEQPYRPGGWTGRQVVHHLADMHLIFYLRFQQALTEDHPTTIPGPAAQAWARRPDVAATPAATSLAVLAAVQARWDNLLQLIPEAQWQRGFFHAGYQRDFTLDQALGVWSQRMVGRVSMKDTRIISPFGTNEFVRRESFQPLEPFGKVVGL